MKNASLAIMSYIVVTGFTPAFAQEAEFVGKVIHVKDGDSIIVMHDQKQEEIRLNGIDCPEKDQPFGDKATEYTKAQCFEKTVTVDTHGFDRYRRTIGDVKLEDGRVLNSELVRNGCAWWYRKYAPGNKELESLEQTAREQHVGLWADRLPVAPWMWRHGVRNVTQLDAVE